MVLGKVFGAVLLAGACVGSVAGGASAQEANKTGPQVLTDAVVAMSKVRDFHVEGRGDDNGNTIILNLSVSASGGGGSIQVGGATMQLVATKAKVYVKATEHSWQILMHGDAAAAQLVANRWVQYPISYPGLAVFTRLTNGPTLVHALLPATVVGSVRRTGISRWDGRPVVVLSVAGLVGRLYVAEKGTPWLLHVQVAGTTLNFTDFGTAPMPSVPAHYVQL